MVRIASLLFFGMLGVVVSDAEAQSGRIDLSKGDGKVTVSIDGKLFTEYDFSTYRKPILYPLIAHGGQAVTRNYPMKSVEGEADDHPHHKSVWFAHGDINGVDYWSERAKIETTKVEIVNQDEASPGIVASHRWIADDESRLFESESEISFFADGKTRMIAFAFRLKAVDQDLVFGDTKEGTFAIRTHPNLRLVNDEKRGVKTANGKAINSEGVAGKAVWGKRARWVDYHGKIDDQIYGVAIFDHPENLRHPTTWHAREYGLVAANPFGLHYFDGGPKGRGEFKLQKGKSTTFKYLLVIHVGDEREADIASRYRAWADPAKK